MVLQVEHPDERTGCRERLAHSSGSPPRHHRPGRSGDGHQAARPARLARLHADLRDDGWEASEKTVTDSTRFAKGSGGAPDQAQEWADQARQDRAEVPRSAQAGLHRRSAERPHRVVPPEGDPAVDEQGRAMLRQRRSRGFSSARWSGGSSHTTSSPTPEPLRPSSWTSTTGSTTTSAGTTRTP